MSGKEKHGFRTFIIFLLILCVVAGTAFFLLPLNERETVINTVKGWFGISETYVSGEIVDTGKTKAAVKKSSDDAEDIIVSWFSNVIRVLEKNNTKALKKLVGKENLESIQKAYQDNPVTRNEKYVLKVVERDEDHIYFGMLYGNNPLSRSVAARGRLTRQDGYWQFDCSDTTVAAMEARLCKECQGYGFINEYSGGGSVCAICGGTGQVYNPYLFLVGNGQWQGGYTACSGCAGAGYIGGASFTSIVCPSCSGVGVK